ncbi:hypothetical protein ACT3CE_07050 [Marinifilum sp. RC60d5]|uniref:hypothetical protein n=1 Tax=Marinifilum sp. RC60d5 TaxID=3458414 RepID=UPI0040356433
MKRIYLFILMFFCLQIVGNAKIKSNGVPFIKNYYKNQYQGGTQNWDIVQTSNGLLYFANNEGVLEFDGNNWRLISMPNQSVVRSLAVDSLDHIFVGAANEFGYLKPDLKGKLTYKSLVDLLPEGERDFREVWNIYPYRKGIIFHTFGSVFYYKNGKVSQIKASNEFRFSFLVNKQFYVLEKGIGLQKLEGSTLKLLKGGEIFNEMEISGILPFKDKSILIATALNGLFISNENGIKAWNVDLNSHLKNEQIFCSLNLSESTYAFGTVRDGVFVLDNSGNLIQHVNKKTGLQNNTVLDLFLDRDENLWLALDNGIDFLEISSPLTVFPRYKDLGAGYASIYYKGYLYLGTNTGLFARPYNFSNGADNVSGKFELVQNTSGQVWSLQEIAGELICGHNKGTFRIKKNKSELLSNVEGGWKYLYKKEFPNKMIGGTYNGLILFEKVQGKWRFIKRISGFEESSREMIWDNDNSIWMCHGYKGVYRIYLNQDLTKCTNYRFYGLNDGLPSNLNISIHLIKNEKVFSSDSGFYKYVSEIDRFEPYKNLNILFGDNGNVNKLFEQAKGDIWFFQGDGVGILKPQLDNSYKIYRKPFSSIKGEFIDAFENVLSVDKENVLIGTERGFIHYDPSITKSYDRSFKTFIREVSLTNLEDSLLYYGGYNKISTVQNKTSKSIILPYKENSIRFKYSAPLYTNTEFIHYKSQLVGFDKLPTKWTKSLQKEYTNLREGEYTFKVLAKNQYGVSSVADEFKFSILPPWYRSVVAYIFYFIVFIFCLYFAVCLVRRRMKRMQVLLEKKQAEELKEKERKYREEALIAEREIVQLRNEKLRSEVDYKNKELASSTMNIIHKNEVLSYSVGELKKALKKIKDPTALVQVRQLMKTIDAEFNSKQDWEQFEIHFDQVHEHFIKRLRTRYPKLTPKDLRLCAYLRMNLSTKEIAPLMNISVRGVEISRYRLRKKFELSRDENLIDFILEV